MACGKFSPSAYAGAYSRGEVTLPLQAALARRPELRAGLTFQAAAGAHGLADRAPARLEVAITTAATARVLANVGHVVVHTPVLPMVDRKGVPVLAAASVLVLAAASVLVLAAASVLVHLAVRPTQVRSWASTAECPIAITPAHLARHTPTGAGSQGRDAALVDIAQDLLLRDLNDEHAVATCRGQDRPEHVVATADTRPLAWPLTPQPPCSAPHPALMPPSQHGERPTSCQTSCQPPQRRRRLNPTRHPQTRPGFRLHRS